MAEHFNDRERAFENKFMHDETVRFQNAARALKKLASWAAEQSYQIDPAAYAEDLIQNEMVKGGYKSALKRIAADLEQSGISLQEIEERFQIILAKMAAARKV